MHTGSSRAMELQVFESGEEILVLNSVPFDPMEKPGVLEQLKWCWDCQVRVQAVLYEQVSVDFMSEVLQMIPMVEDLQIEFSIAETANMATLVKSMEAVRHLQSVKISQGDMTEVTSLCDILIVLLRGSHDCIESMSICWPYLYCPPALLQTALLQRAIQGCTKLKDIEITGLHGEQQLIDILLETPDALRRLERFHLDVIR